MSRRYSVLAMLCLALCGCTAPDGVGDYLGDRGGDLVDVLRGHVFVGKALAAKLEVTRYVSLGGTYEEDVWAMGLHNRGVGTWRETAWGVGWAYYGNPNVHVERLVVGIPRVSGSYGWSVDGGSAGFRSGDPGNLVDWLTVRVTVGLGVGADLEVRIGEAIDFVLGFATIDLARDD